MSEKKEKKCPFKKAITHVHGQMQRILPVLQKHKKGIAGVVGVVLLVFLCVHCAGKTHSIGVVDILQVREKAVVYQGILADQQKYEEAWRDRFNAEKELLTKEDKALADKRSKTKAAAFKKQVDAFQKKVIAFQQKYQMQYTQIMMASQMAVQQADQLAMESMRQLGQEKGVDVILPVQAALYAADTADLTADFIRLFDEAKFSVQYPDPQGIQVPAQQ